MAVVSENKSLSETEPVMYLYETWEHKKRGLMLPHSSSVSCFLFERSHSSICVPLENNMIANPPLMKHSLPWNHPSISFASRSFLCLSLFPLPCYNQSLETGIFFSPFLPLSDLTLGAAPASRIHPSCHRVPFIMEGRMRKKETNLLFRVLPVLAISYPWVPTSITPRRLNCFSLLQQTLGLGGERNTFGQMYLWVSYTPDCSWSVSAASQEAAAMIAGLVNELRGIFSCFIHLV